MKWYNGSIPDAIQLAKSKGSVFIVFVTGEDEESRKMEAVWEERSVLDVCERADCVAIKIDSKSETCQQFAQFYPVVIVPSVFFIDNNGIPLEVTGGALSNEDFAVKIKTTLQAHRIQQSSQTKEAQSSTQQSTDSLPTNTLATEEKVQRAQQLLREKQAKKLEEEREKTIQEEKDRRKIGQSMQDSKMRKEEIEAKEVQMELRRQKEEDKKARERVKEQIARDRADRAARFNKEKQESDREKDEINKARLQAQQQAASEETARRSEIARLQFRLPDGSSVTQTFPSGDTLASARDFISQRVGSTFGTPCLSTVYPRRSFSTEDMESSLTSLQLVPSAVIMVLPEQRNSSSTVSAPGAGLFALLLTPLIAIWNFLYNVIFGAPSRPRGAYNPGASAMQPQESDDDNLPSEVTQSNRPKTAYKRRTPASVSKREGNIHKFSNDDDDDDDMTTWNGNSTQQM